MISIGLYSRTRLSNFNESDMKIRVIHAMLLPEDMPSGIAKQMEHEQMAAKRLGIEWDVKMCYTSKEDILRPNYVNLKSIELWGKSFLILRMLRHALFKFNYYKYLFSLRNKYDIYILRYSTCDFMQYIFLKIMCKHVYFVHHTLEVAELRYGGGTRSEIKAKYEGLIGRFTLPLASGLIGVTEEVLEYELSRAGKFQGRTCVYPNGIIYDHSPDDHLNTGPTELIFVASSFFYWHGLDLLLESIAKSDLSFVLHIIGKTPEHIKKCAQADARIILHGPLDEGEIKQIAKKCSVSLSSFSLDRIGMKYAATLKVRECLLMGLPVYAGHMDVFPFEFPFFKYGPPRIEKIIEYSNSCRVYSKREISEASRPYIDKCLLLGQLYAWLEMK
jgi:glycosyltransferase involved in cell wall biosynthesis